MKHFARHVLKIVLWNAVYLSRSWLEWIMSLLVWIWKWTQ